MHVPQHFRSSSLEKIWVSFRLCIDLKSGQQYFSIIDIFLVIRMNFMAVEDLGIVNFLHSGDPCLEKYELKRQLEWDRMDKNKNEGGAHGEWNERGENLRMHLKIL